MIPGVSSFDTCLSMDEISVETTFAACVHVSTEKGFGTNTFRVSYDIVRKSVRTLAASPPGLSLSTRGARGGAAGPVRWRYHWRNDLHVCVIPLSPLACKVNGVLVCRVVRTCDTSLDVHQIHYEQGRLAHP